MSPNAHHSTAVAKVRTLRDILISGRVVAEGAEIILGVDHCEALVRQGAAQWSKSPREIGQPLAVPTNPVEKRK